MTLCVLCATYGRDPVHAEHGRVCDAHRVRPRSDLLTIGSLHGQLGDWLERSPTPGQRVSGSPTAPLPLNGDVLDLSLPANTRAGSDRITPGPHQADQHGDLPVAQVLDQWARDWRSHPDCPGDWLPVPTVPALIVWLAGRLDWALDHHDAVDEFAADLRRLVSALRHATGDIPERPVYIEGVQCARCDTRDLWKMPASTDRAECRTCGKLYTDEEFRRWVGLLAADARHAENPQAGAA